VAQLRITDRERALLAFAAEHPIFLTDHVRVLRGASEDAANTRLRALHHAGLLVRQKVFDDQPPVHRITRDGLAAVGSELQAPRLSFACYAHDVGVAWLWLAARDEVFGPVARVVGERRLRSADLRRESGEPPLAMRLGGTGPGGRERLHYPDLLLVDPAGRRIALELELTDKGRRRRERILAGYGADPRFGAVVYLVPNRRLGRAITASARRLGIQSSVYVQLVRMSVEQPGADPAPTRVPLRSRPQRDRSATRAVGR